MTTAPDPGSGTAAPEGAVLLDGLTAGDVVDGQLYRASLPNGTAVVVGRHDGSWFAHKDCCPHAEYPLSEGTLYANGELECCWHGAKFNCLTGALLGGPAEQGLVRFDVTERDGALWVKRSAGGAR
ncbi:MAG: Rieske 2Fe-2S domain-containing protein [Gemmatimonadaceae bacterium]|nr:Rieske 2Fe-2S domain-containing protein [Gemmatimonadaceae bacterium]